MFSALSKRSGPLFGLCLVVVGLLAAISPVIPAASAVDPTPDPAGAAPSIDPAAASVDPAATPTPDPTAAPDPTPTPDPAASPAPTANPDPTASPVPAGPGLRVTHYWIDTENDLGTRVTLGSMDTPLGGMDRFVVYRVRFQVVNDGDTSLALAPSLEFGAGADPASWAPVATVDPVDGMPFYAASDDGRGFRVRTAVIASSSLRLSTSDDPAAAPAAGVASAGVNPAPTITLAAHSFTEVQFSVRATVSADWTAAYAFRLRQPAGGPLVAAVRMRTEPVFTLPPGATTGVQVPATLPAYPLKSTGGINARLASTVTSGPSVYPLGGVSSTSPHDNLGMTLTSDACAACHIPHAAQGPYLRATSTMSGLCFLCHDGTGSTYDVKSQWTSLSLPANDASTRSYYSHPATDPASTHVSAQNAEFAGVLNRHAQCADCHQPHVATDAVPAGTSSGWTASGAIAGASGVAVTNGAAGASPAYTLTSTSAKEYELCFKCHSGYTTLLAQDPSHPSRWSLDKAVELNPANVSYHPVEAAGKNQENWMQNSLQGAAVGKLWAFSTTSVIRCENCHGSSSATSPAVDGRIDNHASANRGILLRNYRDRTLKATGASYSTTDFALCYLCHAELPMKDTSGGFTTPQMSNFEFHGLHVSGISGNGSGGTDIDVAGAGQGNAVCAECHFRIHGDALAVNGQTPAPGLVNFAPNVRPFGGQIRFVQATATTFGTCTLTCHGKQHDALEY
ncbi:MAG: cytochrome c3 family protein [Chloroflexota bacterium]